MSADFIVTKAGDRYQLIGKKSGSRIGFIRYNQEMGVWIFYPGTATGFSAGALKEIASTLKELKNEG